jgi:oligoendopeptidase F
MRQETEDQLNFNHLPRYQKRQFVPEEADLTNCEELKGLYNQLIEREILSAEDFEQWILDRSELEASVDQQGAILYIRMTCQTDDEARVQSYKNFIERVVPALKPLEDLFNKRYLERMNKFQLNKERYDMYTREIRTDLELFVDANIALETKVDVLSQEYQSICGALTVEFEGKERTMAEMNKFLLEPDRALRERAWRASTQRRLKEKDKLDAYASGSNRQKRAV